MGIHVNNGIAVVHFLSSDRRNETLIGVDFGKNKNRKHLRELWTLLGVTLTAWLVEVVGEHLYRVDPIGGILEKLDVETGILVHSLSSEDLNTMRSIGSWASLNIVGFLRKFCCRMVFVS